MGRVVREIHDSTVVVQSSIALLQERFRQLQRVKEMREEREMIQSAEQYYHLYNSSKHTIRQFLIHPELINNVPFPPSSPNNYVSLSLWPTWQEDHRRSPIEFPISTNCNTNSLEASWKKNVYDWDSDSAVDTSLHL